MRQEEKDAATAAWSAVAAQGGFTAGAESPCGAIPKGFLGSEVVSSAEAEGDGSTSAAAAEPMRSSRAGQLPEQYGGGTLPAMPFTNGNCLFNGFGSLFGGSLIAQQWELPSDPST